MKLWIGIVMVLLIAGGTAYGVNAMEHEETGFEETKEKSYKSKELSPETAKQIAVEKVNGVVEEIDVERMDDNGVYEIEVETNVGEEEIYINKKNGNIIAEKEFELIKNEDDDEQDEDDMDHDDLDD
ncbi:PepSY domain-containing protein [Bacillus pacificus]|uniref:PepSY domain-containing protein n=1 Tax=Bacillus TaxID=1386 RepID=UPI000349D0EF|nr:PepSY domain-containing protein [Bacillus pacificus]MCC2417033.1 PepSY domain-containing protein [Bacillus pacificus]MCU5004189.1 PepSY domain-containing protein [Bacillus pacificus]MCU5254944.1 PepSY domain-containing protein [Bacillus pacificus]MCU5561674.1 PepSY domain-containing protein [Bacillus pacificus]HDR3521715.1 PepSY domain-containing protein [Bacillus pacificus]